MKDHLAKKVAVDRFSEAAAKAGVPTETFVRWLQDYFAERRLNPKQWSHWKTGTRPIPEKYVILYLRAQLSLAETPVEHDPGRRRKVR